jgi:hypothetical protein
MIENLKNAKFEEPLDMDELRERFNKELGDYNPFSDSDLSNSLPFEDGDDLSSAKGSKMKRSHLRLQMVTSYLNLNPKMGCNHPVLY